MPRTAQLSCPQILHSATLPSFSNTPVTTYYEREEVIKVFMTHQRKVRSAEVEEKRNIEGGESDLESG